MKSLLHIPRAKAQIAGYTWISEASRLLSSAIIVFSSIQLGLHFWPSSSLISGVRVDYLSPTLLFFDLLLLLSIILFRIENGFFLKRIKSTSPLIFIGLTNLIFTTQPLQSLIWWLRLIVICLVIPPVLKRQFGQSRIKVMIWLGLLTLIASIQVYLGHSIQGIIYWLGERRLFLGQPGVASQIWEGEEYLRGYSIFPHPNIFAGWSLLTLLLPYQKSQNKWPATIHALMVSVGIILSSSRAALLGLIILLYQKIRSKTVKFVFILTLFAVLAFIWQGKDALSLSERIGLISKSVLAISSSPLFGLGALHITGIRDAVVVRFQPDHFLPTLLTSWFGIVGIFQLLNVWKVRIIYPLLPLFFLDHYLVTNHATLFLVLVVIYSMSYQSHSDCSKLS